MTQLIDLGKLRFYFAGDWSNSATYESNDIVRYGGNVYVYTYAVKTSGNLPTNTTYWALMVSGIKFVGAYDPAVFYPIGDAVAYGGKVYISIADSTGQTPPNLTYWSQFADGIEYMGTYSAITAYKKNDIVTYGPNAYTASQDTTGNDPTNTAYWNKMVTGVSASGAWSASTNYVPGNLVAYGANLYIAKANNINQLPINSAGTLNGTYWDVYSTGIRSLGDWVTTQTYYINDVVSYGGNTFICIAQHASTVFATDLAANKWKKFNSGIRARGNWASATSYLVNDVVTTSTGSAYIAIADHTSSASFNTDLVANNWTLLAAGGASVLPAIVANTAGKSLTLAADNATLYWANVTGSAYILYVAPNGNDSNPGTSLALPFASIKKAVSMVPAGQKTAILVKSGTYSESALPIVVPENTAIIGDNTRTTFIQPAAGNAADGTTPNAQATMFLMSNGSLVNKLTFQGMTGWTAGSTATQIETSTPKGIFFALNPASPITTKSPYILECTSISSGGIGAYVDGSVHSSGYKSMLFHEYTLIEDNGVGLWMNNGGKSEAVSVFTYFCYFGYATTNGGQLRSLSGNNSYGNYGTYSSGYDSSESTVTGSVYGSMITLTGNYAGVINPGDTITSSSGATATVLNAQAQSLYVANITGTFAGTNTITSSSGGTATVGSIGGQNGFVLVLNNLTALPQAGGSIQLAGDSSAYIIQSVSGGYTNSSSVITLVLAQQKVAASTSGTVATIRYKVSLLRVTGHDFLSVGTGGITTTNYPGTPTQQPAPSQQVNQVLPGRIYYVSTDQLGNFNVGQYFSVNQATGKATLNASAFDLSGLSSLRLGSIGAQLGAQINEFSTDGTMSQNSPIKVPTQSAVVTYVGAQVAAVAGSLNSVLGDAYSFATNPSGTFSDKTFRASFASGGGTFTWSLTGTPPSGLSITQSGILTTGNTAIAAGTYSFNIVVTSGSVTVSKAVTIVSNANAPIFSATSIPVTLAPSTAYTINAATATVSSGTITYAVASGALPSGMSLNTSTGVLSGTAGANSTTPIVLNFTISATANGYTVTKTFTGNLYYINLQGQSLFGTNVGPGNYNWVAPTGVTSVCVVCVGAGGWGGYSWSSGGSGGGGLGWKNNIAVTPGQTYAVQVGSYGTQPSNSATSSNGTPSFFINAATVAGYAGGTGGGGASGSGNAYGGGFAGDGGGVGGTGGSGSWTGGGGGAGGYTGSGGNFNSAGAGGGGGGAASYYSSTWGTGGGGGVGLYGQGANGSTAGYNPWSPGYGGSGGQGGSGGADGDYGELPWAHGTCKGGDYGGGGGGSGTSTGQNNPNLNQQRGGAAGVRIIWGNGRSFPSTNTADVTVYSL